MSNSSKKLNAADAPPESKSPRSSPYWGLGTHDFYRALANKAIKLTALDGRTYCGKLVGIDQYDLFVRQANGLTLLFPKHAVKFLHADGDSTHPAKEKNE